MAEMVNPQVSLPTLVLLVLTSLQLLIGRNWRLMLVSLAAQYLGAFALVSLSWPVNLAWVKLVAGWMACLLLLVAVGNTTKLLQEDISSSGRLFRLLAAGLVALAIISSTRRMQIWLPDIDLVVVLASLVLIGMGLLHLACRCGGG